MNGSAFLIATVQPAMPEPIIQNKSHNAFRGMDIKSANNWMKKKILGTVYNDGK